MRMVYLSDHGYIAEGAIVEEILAVYIIIIIIILISSPIRGPSIAITLLY